MSIEAMKQALEVMGLMGADLICEAAHHKKKDLHEIGEPCPIQQRWHKAFDALRTAIAEAEKPEAWEPSDTSYRPGGLPQDFIGHESEKQEPVAWRWVPSKVWHDYVMSDDPERAKLASEHGIEVQPLYTTPPAAPVQDERDWSLLEATQESLREHMAEIKRLKAIIEATEKQEPVLEVVNGQINRSWDAIPSGFTGLLYTAPPAAKRPWVGLTDEQINQYDYEYRDLLYDAEKMLKENNT
jgi:hypothetical protein